MLIVTDLDGTLLNEEGKLTDYTKKILKEVSKDNILIAASGRGLTGIKAALEDIYSYFSYFIKAFSNSGDAKISLYLCLLFDDLELPKSVL